jgi:hypothetical integral membrane protein (TIGR02206 family)
MVEQADDRFVAFGPEHWLILGLFAAGCAAAVLVGLRLTGPSQVWFRRVAGLAILVICGPFQTINWVNAVGAWRTGLPVQICDFAWIVAVVALLTGRATWSAVLYYWGLTLTVQAVVTPDLGSVFPQVQFFGYWVRHVLAVWAACYLVGAGKGPDWRGYRFTLALTAAWAAAVMSLNFAVGSNYGYLNAKPVSASILDVLGPWPWYVVVEALLIAGAWALLTWPWNRKASAPVTHQES